MYGNDLQPMQGLGGASAQRAYAEATTTLAAKLQALAQQTHEISERARAIRRRLIGSMPENGQTSAIIEFMIQANADTIRELEMLGQRIGELS